MNREFKGFVYRRGSGGDLLVRRFRQIDGVILEGTANVELKVGQVVHGTIYDKVRRRRGFAFSRVYTITDQIFPVNIAPYDVRGTISLKGSQGDYIALSSIGTKRILLEGSANSDLRIGQGVEMYVNRPTHMGLSFSKEYEPHAFEAYLAGSDKAELPGSWQQKKAVVILDRNEQKTTEQALIMARDALTFHDTLGKLEDIATMNSRSYDRPLVNNLGYWGDVRNIIGLDPTPTQLGATVAIIEARGLFKDKKIDVVLRQYLDGINNK